MPRAWTNEEITSEVAKFNWYHKIKLAEGIVTPGYNFEAIWDIVRKTRDHVDYRDKTVLDLGSFNGMWAFEAEGLGAKLVVATDVYYENTYESFLFCREVLRSKVVPYYNVSPYKLWDRLDVFLEEAWEKQKPYERLFDIVQHLGLLYHVRDPLYTLSQSRSVLRTGGHLLMETGVVLNQNDSFMLFNGMPDKKNRIYKDITTWWAPTLPCLKEMLQSSLFEPIEETIHTLPQRMTPDNRFQIGRVCLVARAISSEDVPDNYYKELSKTYRNPGLVTDFVGQKC